MSDAAELSVTAVVTLVLGGVAAFVLALLIALGGYGSPKKVSPGPSARAASSAAPASSRSLEELEAEYPLDWDEPTQSASERQR